MSIDWASTMRILVRQGARDCHDCGAKPGQPHLPGCDTEICSVCGGQRLCCECKGHDPLFAHWTGFWPGGLEALALGLDLNELVMRQDLWRLFFIKPKAKELQIDTATWLGMRLLPIGEVHVV